MPLNLLHFPVANRNEDVLTLEKGNGCILSKGNSPSSREEALHANKIGVTFDISLRYVMNIVRSQDIAEVVISPACEYISICTFMKQQFKC